MVFGLLYNAFVPVPSWTALLWALTGLTVGLFALVPFHALRIMGAGDVKLMAMVGAIVALPDAVHAVLWSLIAGGLVALGYAIYRKAFRQLAGNLAQIFHSFAFAAIGADLPSSPMAGRASVGRFPYGMSIAVGTIVWLIARRLVFA
jgi:prepilin peptidase CpaA